MRMIAWLRTNLSTAETDAEALKAARQLVDGCDVEVWHLDRKIGRLGRDKK
jgi:hypothetical protein